MSRELAFASSPITRENHAPYLVCDAVTFAKDQMKRRWYEEQWISRGPELGNSLKDKMAWMASIGSFYLHEQAQLVDNGDGKWSCVNNWFVPSPKDVVARVFLDIAPPSLEIELYCTKSDLKSILIGDSRLFASHCRKFSHPNYHGPSSWSVYMKWLQSLDSDIVMLASIACKKRDRLQDKINELAENLSIDVSLDRSSVFNCDEFAGNPSICWWSLVEHAGGNLYYATPTSQCAVTVRAFFSRPSSNRLANMNYLRSLNQKSRYSRETVGTHYDFMIVPKAGRDVKTVLGSTESAKLEENFGVLWLGSSFKCQVQRITDHFSGHGETIEFQVNMQKGPTQTASALLMICAAELKFLEKIKRKKELLVSALALTVSFTDISPLWARCEDTKREAAIAVGKLGDIWRYQILSVANSSLGINDEIRQVVYRALQLREHIFFSSGLVFEWKPIVKLRKLNPKRKRDTSPDSVVANEINDIVNEALLPF